ncbi:MAG: enoyl-CoA hydratase/isomerase family protein [Anaerolineae bacterium]
MLILTGEGRAFVAGADIDDYLTMTLAQFSAFQRLGRSVMAQMEQLPRPILAAVNGYALGGGFEIALACDVIVAAENAKFGLPEAKLGLLPGGGGAAAGAAGRGGHRQAADLLRRDHRRRARLRTQHRQRNRSEGRSGQCGAGARRENPRQRAACRSDGEAGDRRGAGSVAADGAQPGNGCDRAPVRQRRQARGHSGIRGKAPAALHRDVRGTNS